MLIRNLPFSRVILFAWVIVLSVFASGCASFLESLRLEENQESTPPGIPYDSPENGMDAQGMQDRVEMSQSGSAVPEAWDSEARKYRRLDRLKKTKALDGMPDFKQPFRRVTSEDFIDHSQDAGSLWASSGQTNYYFLKNKVRAPGDIVSLEIEEELFKNIGNEIKDTLSKEEKTQEVAMLREKEKRKIMKLPIFKEKENDKEGTSQVPARAVASTSNEEASSLIEIPKNNKELKESDVDDLVEKISISDVDIFKKIQIKPSEKMMGEIVHRYPNGNYRIIAVKKVPYENGKDRWVRVTGIVKSADIAEETDLIMSGKLYAPSIEIAI